MKNTYDKPRKEYEQPFELEVDKILAAMKRHRQSPKKTASIALDEATVRELKNQAMKQGIPYQVLIRVFIREGLDRMKKSTP